MPHGILFIIFIMYKWANVIVAPEDNKIIV